MIYYTNKTNKVDVWGGYNLDDNVDGFIVVGYADSNGSPIAANKIVLYATVQPEGSSNTESYTLIVNSGDVISKLQEGIGKITRLEDSGARIRIVLIKH